MIRPIDAVLKSVLDASPAVHLDRPADLSLARESRRHAVRGEAPSTAVGRVKDIVIPATDAPPIAARVYWPLGFEDAGELPLAVYYHGGGFALGSIDTHDWVARSICAHIEAVVVSVDYRLAPENPYPAAVDDAFAALTWAAEHATELGADPARIAVAGDSAGGNLATVAAQLAKSRGGPHLKFQLLWYPGTTSDLSLPSVIENAAGPVLSRDMMRIFGQAYLGELSETADPTALPFTVAPVNGDLEGLPPVYIATAQHDPLRDDGRIYAALLAEAGVAVQLRNADALVHGYLDFARIVPAAKEEFLLSLDACKAVL
ncbi:alpha/beta hydrolase [Mycobacteroides chelonae]|uniref:alpha/beta hydrolase n=1 Tax=Mycobacteroides chelonae TaxID=1774 RepID=UPI000AE3732C|nr:alpha/beta hydrolase [Mycobacteroides chelonae]MBV0917383.1 alpha/beta hydrolase [Mycobacteroides chelonae]GLE56334.1 putative lipase LipH (carboxylesterase) [Mycobacteroides chelonae]